jgi:hypothetical protein
MLRNFDEYGCFNATESERESDKIINGLCRKLWKESGYAVAYWLGAVNQLKFMARSLKGSYALNRECCLEIIKNLKTTEEVPDEVKNLIDTILNEFKDKEN